MVSIKDIRTLLVENPFFEGMGGGRPYRHIDMLAGCGKLVHFKAGESLLREGDEADTFYLIRDGLVGIESAIPATGPMSVSRISAGGITGYSWLFPPYRNHFDLRALTRVSALALDGACLRGKPEADHELGYHLMTRFARVMLDRLESARLQLLDVYAGGGA